MTPREKLAAGRLMAKEKAPYFRAALFSLMPRTVDGLGTIAVTEHGVLLWDPEVLGQWTVTQIAGALIHEVGHLLRDHTTRGKKFAPTDNLGWNMATDAEINDDLKEGGWELPFAWYKPGDEKNPDNKYVLLPACFGCKDGLTAEEYYQHLPNALKKNQVGGRLGAGKCGSAGGNPVNGEPKDGSAEAKEGRSEAEIKRVRHETAEAIRDEAQKSRGTVPGGWLRWAGEYLQPAKVRWQDELARECRAAIAYRPGAVDYRYDRPTRRQGALGYGTGRPILPVMRSPIPKVAFVIDTSGSMGSGEMEMALREGQGVITAVGAQITFISIDSDIHTFRQVRRWKEMAENLKGGGGTDFRPAFEHLSRANPRPDVIVFVTDGCGPAPQTAPASMKVIWLLVGPYKQRPCNWGKVIELDSDTKKDSQ
jgi:predicted metal-dependent peptidase